MDVRELWYLHDGLFERDRDVRLHVERADATARRDDRDLRAVVTGGDALSPARGDGEHARQRSLHVAGGSHTSSCNDARRLQGTPRETARARRDSARLRSGALLAERHDDAPI